MGRGERKLNDELHEEILSKFAAGTSIRVLAKEYGVSPTAIHYIVKGEHTTIRLRLPNDVVKDLADLGDVHEQIQNAVEVYLNGFSSDD